ncbi:hypothetical protein N825_06465 [Skermanella stibiiresistens SB22]|jgi:hypothetical protein|uniref:Uncharacterized protein n=1 Tax=Skermanella stibiiresistens SB22 TaxID=1385369 RepID=W9H3X1_9PROT|nr:hypothetical protein N825_06465 [Skermanella stibiiresistens SB22]
MKRARKRRPGVDPMYLILGGALVLMVVLITYLG